MMTRDRVHETRERLADLHSRAEHANTLDKHDRDVLRTSMQVLYSMIWFTDKPVEIGIYLYKHIHDGKVYGTQVRPGRWQEAQNPEAFYYYDVIVEEWIVVADTIHPYWMGPFPEVPEQP